MALAYATSDRGACHMRSWPIANEALSEDENADAFGPDGKAEFIVREQDENSREWSLVGCDFIGYGPDDALSMLKAVGIGMSTDEYERLGTRVWNLVRLFNLRQGWTADDDYVPRAIQNPLEDSGRALAPETFEAMKKDYYSVRGWDEAGRPTAQLVAALGLEEYV
jgi:aldehyde:ferredoxin oxidoreductase